MKYIILAALLISCLPSFSQAYESPESKKMLRERIQLWRESYRRTDRLIVDSLLEKKAQKIAVRLHSKIKRDELLSKKHHTIRRELGTAGENLAYMSRGAILSVADRWHSSKTGHREIMIDRGAVHMGLGISTKAGRTFIVLLVDR